MNAPADAGAKGGGQGVRLFATRFKVVARLQADIGPFAAKIEEARQMIKGLKEDITDVVKIKTDDSSLKKISDEAERLSGFTDKAMKIKLDMVDGTRTWAELTAINAEMDHLNGKTARMKVKVDVDQGGLISKLGALTDKATGAIGGFSGIGPLPGGAAGVGILAAAVPAAAALLVELTGVVAGLSASAAGASAFAVLALPAFHSVSNALSQIKTDQQAYDRALTSKEKATALAHLKQDWASLDPLQKQAVLSLDKFSTTYHQMARAFEPKAFQVFTSGLKLAGDILPHITPFASTFADSMSRWMTNLDKASKGKGFQDFLKSFHGIEGPALQAIAAGIGNVAGSVGRLLTVMSGKDVAHSLNIAFSAISGTIGAITTTVRFLMNLWDGMGLAIGNVKGALHGVAAEFDTIRHGFADSAHSWAASFDQVRHAAATAAHNIASAFDTVRHDIAAKFDGVKSAIAAKFDGAASWLRSFAHNIATGFDTVRHDIAAKFDGIKGDIVSKFSGAIGWLVSAGAAVLQGFLNGLLSVWNKVTSFVGGIAGWIASHKGPVEYDFQLLQPAGRAIMDGLMAAMDSRMGALRAQVGGINATLAGAGGGHWVGSAGPEMTSYRGMASGGAGNHAGLAGAAGGGEIVVHSHVHLDGREIFSGIQRQATTTQRRTGHTGLSRRTR